MVNLKKFRKKGSVILNFLFITIALTVIFAIMFNISIGYESAGRIDDATEKAARVRATAVDIALKERYGFVESFHDSSQAGYNDNLSRSMFETHTEGYESNLYDPNTERYKQNKLDVDAATKTALINSASASVGANTSGEKMVDIKPENICIQVIPLPTGDTGTVNFSCGVEVNGQAVVIQKEGISVNGSDAPINNKNGAKVMNVVVVGVAYENKHFVYEALQKALNGSDPANWDAPPVRTTYAIAYPQIDACSGANCNR